MWRNFFVSYFRNLTKNKVPALLNFLGLTVGLSCSVIMMLFVQRELSFDTYPARAESVYRVVFGGNDDQGSVYTPQILGTALQARYPGVIPVRFNNAGNARTNFKHGEKQFMESAFFFTDPAALEVFSFPLLQGDPSTCLTAPFTIVLTQQAAQKYFGEEDPMGKSISIDWAGAWYDLAVTGVIKEVPATSHINFDYLISIATAERIFQPKTFFTDWTANYCVTYLLIDKSGEASVAEGLTPLYLSNMTTGMSPEAKLRLQPLSKIHLYSRLSGELFKNSDIRYLYLAGSVGVLILFISFINYINIISALYTLRLKEIGVRKVLGAGRSSILWQFLAESFLNIFCALLAAVCATVAISPFLAGLIGREWNLYRLLSTRDAWWIPVSLLVIGVLAGIYPSSFVASRNAGDVLYGKIKQTLRTSWVRNTLVGSQFFIALLILAGALVVNRQLKFLQEKDIGFDSSFLLSIPQGRIIREKSEFIKHEMARTGKVVSATLSSQIPSRNLGRKVPAIVEGGNPDGTSEPWPVHVVSVDYDFFSTFGLTVADGRTFSTEFPSDSSEAFVLNEAAVRALHWTAPLGREIQMTYNAGNGTVETRKGRVIGVIRDFHFESLHKSIEPVVFFLKPFWFYFATFRITSDDPVSAVYELQKKWETLVPDAPFEYVFMNDRLEQLYLTERTWARCIELFSIIAIAISSLGLFGLVAFLVQSRLREIAVRKLLGADSRTIFLRLYGSVMIIVITASLLAMPVATFLTKEWLSGFAYHIAPGPELFLTALVGVVLVSSLVIVREVVRASRLNPVDILKTE